MTDGPRIINPITFFADEYGGLGQDLDLRPIRGPEEGHLVTHPTDPLAEDSPEPLPAEQVLPDPEDDPFGASELPQEKNAAPGVPENSENPSTDHPAAGSGGSTGADDADELAAMLDL